MNRIKTPSTVSLHEMFKYINGTLYWRERISGYKKNNSSIAGYERKDGYWSVSYKGKKYLLHRIIFKMFYGYCPDYIDHIDNDPRNNKIANLQESNNSHNMLKSIYRKDNTSGYRGVSLNKKTNKYVAFICSRNLGYFDTEKEASVKYELERLKLLQQ